SAATGVWSRPSLAIATRVVIPSVSIRTDDRVTVMSRSGGRRNGHGNVSGAVAYRTECGGADGGGVQQGVGSVRDDPTDDGAEFLLSHPGHRVRAEGAGVPAGVLANGCDHREATRDRELGRKAAHSSGCAGDHESIAGAEV